MYSSLPSRNPRKCIAAVGVAEHSAQVALDPLSRIQPRRQRLSEPEHEVEHRDLPWLGDHLARDSSEVQRQAGALAGELREVQAQKIPEVDVPKRLGILAGGYPHHLLRRDPVGAEGRDERPSGSADVDVEVVDGAVDSEQVECAQRPDLVHPAREAPAAEHQSGLTRTAPAATRAGSSSGTHRWGRISGALTARAGEGGAGTARAPRRGVFGRFQLDNATHTTLIVGLRVPAAVCTANDPARALTVACAVAPGTVAMAATTTALRAHMAHELRLAGAQSGAYVYDMSTAQTLDPSAPSSDARRRQWRSSTPRPPPWSGWGRRHGSKPPCSASASSPREACGKAASTYAAGATPRSGAPPSSTATTAASAQRSPRSPRSRAHAGHQARHRKRRRG